MTAFLPLLAIAQLDSKSIDAKVSALLKRMTLEEKVGQLVQFSNGSATGPEGARVDQTTLIAKGGMGSILNATGAAATNALQRQAIEKSRLGIPLIFGLDVIHGYRTIFPSPLGLSATWDPALIERTARVAAVEASSEGVRWTFSPMVDIARDARWGRILEGAGEDPWLGSQVAAAYVRGYQGKNLADPTSILACVKHFAAYGAVESGREYNAVDISDRALRQTYLPPYQAAVDAGAATVMTSFNTLQGIPATANRMLMTDILRGEWGFKGFVVSDWGAVGELIPHGVALDATDAALKGITAGTDMDMAANAYASKLVGLVKAGKLKTSVVDEAARRILRVKFAMGLFDRPYTDENLAAKTLLAPDHLDLAREAAEASFVLLKNEKNLLPLQPNQRVALIGPLADSPADMLGGWAAKGQPKDAVSLRAALPNALYAKGTDLDSTSEDGFTEAMSAAKSADVVVMALGEGRNMSGEAHSRTKLGLPGNQLELLKAVAATGKPIVLVVFSGRPLALPWEAEHIPAILEAWFPGVQAGPALKRTLFGEASPSGRLTASFPRSVGQMPLYYNALNTGRPVTQDTPTRGYLSGYLDERNSPQFPFGWGLTYTTFDYSAPTILTPKITAADLRKGTAKIEIEATVTNSGSRPGIETAQLYINERGTSVARPIRELKGFQRLTLAPGESRRIRFTLTGKDLAFIDDKLKLAVEPCQLTLWIAPNALAGTPASIRIE